MQKWIDEGREYNRKCNHNFFFRGTKDYANLSTERWSNRIKNIFYQEAKVPVTPKELRKMYVTYLKDQGVSEAELEAAASWMKHSRLMQSKIYDQQNKTNKMAPIQSFNPLLSLSENSTNLRRFSPRKIKVSPQFDRRGLR